MTPSLMGYDSARELHEREEGLVCPDEGREQTDFEGRASRVYAGSWNDSGDQWQRRVPTRGFKNAGARRPYVNPSAVNRATQISGGGDAERVFPRARAHADARVCVSAEGSQVPLKTGGYQASRRTRTNPGGRDVGREGPLEESRGHSITF